VFVNQTMCVFFLCFVSNVSFSLLLLLLVLLRRVYLLALVGCFVARLSRVLVPSMTYYLCCAEWMLSNTQAHTSTFFVFSCSFWQIVQVNEEEEEIAVAPPPAPTLSPEERQAARQRQWQWLVDTQNVVVDPHDRDAVWDELLNRAIDDNLSATQINLILRRVRELNSNDGSNESNSDGRFVDPGGLLGRLLPNSSSTVVRSFGWLAKSLHSHRTMDAVFAMLGIASSPPRDNSKRQQRLQLLFYLCAEPDALKALTLAAHAAAWLLEVGNGETVEVDSIQHYHTHGTVFLPVIDSGGDDDDNKGKPPFVSDEEGCITVSAGRVRELVQAALATDQRATVPGSSGSAPISTLMERLQWNAQHAARGEGGDPYYRWSRDNSELAAVVSPVADNVTWTLQEFADWAREALDDRALGIVFYRLLLQGVLPSPATELDLVLARWMTWQRQQQPNGDNCPRSTIALLSDREPTTLCCVHKEWWNWWASYSGWTFDYDDDDSNAPQPRRQVRPPAIANQNLFDTSQAQHGVQVGTRQDAEYVPPSVWDCLYELYGGGPPVLCTMVPIVDATGKVNWITCQVGPSSLSAISGTKDALQLPPGLGVCGLDNLGKSSWMSPVVQCLNAAPLLRAYWLGGLYSSTNLGHLNRNNPLGAGGRIVEAVACALGAMRDIAASAKQILQGTGRSVVYRPTGLGREVERASNGQFSVTVPQDAQEFLNFLLEMLHEDVNIVQRKPYVEALDEDWKWNHRLGEVATASWRR